MAKRRFCCRVWTLVGWEVVVVEEHHVGFEFVSHEVLERGLVERGSARDWGILLKGYED